MNDQKDGNGLMQKSGIWFNATCSWCHRKLRVELEYHATAGLVWDCWSCGAANVVKGGLDEIRAAIGADVVDG